jgi:hypothetical protein
MVEHKEIVVTLIAVFGAVIPYLFQKNKELKLKIAGSLDVPLHIGARLLQR